MPKLIESNVSENCVFRPPGKLDLLARVSKLLSEASNLKEVGESVLEEVVNATSYHYSAVTLLNRETGGIETKFVHGISSEQAERGKYRIGEGVTGRVVQTGKSAIIARVSEDQEYLNNFECLGGVEHSFICVPISIDKNVVGTLSAGFPFDINNDLQAQLDLLSIISSMIAQTVRIGWAAQEHYHILSLENARLKAELETRFKPSNIIGNSHEMRPVYDQIAQISSTSATALIQGETGTGKELVAQAIHYNSKRAKNPFVKVHCGALTESIIESELFGHEKGAFTGALNKRVGRFEQAHRGTLFLDEIGDISPSVQIKLLRVLQEREFERVGGTETIHTDVRLIAATNRDLAQLVSKGLFREDLYYRLNVFPIFVPPLRKRRTDITLLADYFLEKYSSVHDKKVSRLSSAAIDMLCSYHWPGNVRELENVIERALLICEHEVIHPHNLPPSLQTASHTGTAPSGSLKEIVEAYERDIVVDALKSSGGNIAKAAKDLGSTQRIIAYKVKNFGIDPKRYST